MSRTDAARFLVRPARPDDAAALAAIYAPYVTDSFISFEREPPDAREMAARIAATMATHPWLVAESVVAGEPRPVAYAYGTRFRAREAYQWSCEVSAYVDAAWHRRGLGRLLYAELLAALRGQGYLRCFAGIALPNPTSVAFHESFGFQSCGVFRAAGYKLGGWHDVGFWELPLGPLPEVPVPPVTKGPA